MSIYLKMRGITDGRLVINGVKFLPMRVFEDILQTPLDFNIPYIITNEDIKIIIEYYEKIIKETPRNDINSYILDSIEFSIIPSLKQELPQNHCIKNEWYVVILE